jgi:hypothetical protein
VEIDGYAIGITTAHSLNMQTLSGVTVRNASRVGLRHRGQTLADDQDIRVERGATAFVSNAVGDCSQAPGSTVSMRHCSCNHLFLRDLRFLQFKKNAGFRFK